MQYKVKINEKVYPIDARPVDDSGRYTMALNGEAMPVVIKAVSSNHVHLEIRGKAHNLFVARSEDGTWIWDAGRVRLVKDASMEQHRRSRAPSATAREITPPTPASVVRILVEAGEKVVKGQGIIVVSAMKMEMTLSAPYSGTVSAVNTRVGAQVSPGQILAEITPDEEVGGNG